MLSPHEHSCCILASSDCKTEAVSPLFDVMDRGGMRGGEARRGVGENIFDDSVLVDE